MCETLTFGEVMSALRVTHPTVRALLKSGKLHGIKVGRLWRIPRQSLENYLLAGEKRGGNEKGEPTAAQEAA